MKLEMILDSKAKDLGGFVVRRAFPQAQKRMVGPFVFFDQMGPVDFTIGNGIDVRPHPHIGLSTLTYLFEGEIIHRDTLGVEQAIRPGAVNWMTAGSGVAHSERSSQEARKVPQKLHGIQTWLALPKEKEEIAPSFDHHKSDVIPEISFNGVQVKIIVGELAGLTSAVKSHSETTYLELHLPKNKSFEMDSSDQELAVYCVSGKIDIDGKAVAQGMLGVFQKSDQIAFKALEPSHVLVLGGLPIGERHIWWNFVSSSKERIEQAKLDWKNKKFGSIKGETEFIPLPEN